MRADKETIRRRALHLVSESGRGVARRLGAEFGLSRQVANGHLQALVSEGLLEGTGSTRSRTYLLAASRQAIRSFILDGLSEDSVWREVFAPVVADFAENVRDIWRYGITEMVNNAIDHSGSAQVHVGVRRTALHTEAWVADDGEGIFLKIQRALGLYDPREAILELAKGKFTTDQAHHSGEGIFFTSKVFDAFDVQSGRLHFMHDHEPLDRLLGRPAEAPGTLVLLRLANDSARTTRSVFDEYAAPDAYTFDRTVVPLRLAQYEGEKLVSRSQAKRIYRRFERFRHVVLDFDGVAEIGQAFADELFRVFPTAHPSVELEPVNVSADVARMISRVKAAPIHM